MKGGLAWKMTPLKTFKLFEPALDLEWLGNGQSKKFLDAGIQDVSTMNNNNLNVSKRQ